MLQHRCVLLYTCTKALSIIRDVALAHTRDCNERDFNAQLCEHLSSTRTCLSRRKKNEKAIR